MEPRIERAAVGRRRGFNKRQTGLPAYYEVDDVKAALQSLVAAGAEIKQDAADVGGGQPLVDSN